jgi:SAM-dependent methyltransferase
MARESFWEFERAGWERAAARYEECWTDTALFVRPLLDAVAVHDGLRLLDIACGPGYVSEAAAARGAYPVGLDVAEAMIERARRRCPGLSFVVDYALHLPFPDAYFDAVTMNFGILHVSDPQLAVAEARRVLVGGGRFAFTTWVEEGNAQDEITAAALGEHGVAVEVPAGPSYYVFSELHECRAALASAGFDRDSARMETVTVQWRIAAPDTLFEAQLHAGVRTAAVLRGQPPDRLQAIRAAMAAGVRGYADGDDFALPIVARVTAATAR